MAFGELEPVPARQHARRFARNLEATCIYAAITLMTLWSALALLFDLPLVHARIIAAIAFLVIIASILYFAKRRWLQFFSILVCFILVLSWWLTLKPYNNQPWQTDVSKLASIEITNNHAIIHNFRQCDYRTELDYTCTWSTVDVDLARIQGVDLFMNYWGSPWIAHTIVSFDLGNGRHVAYSIETRKQVGQTYSALRGFFRQYTLISVVSDERDLVRLRTNYRHGEDLYLYHTRATPAFARSLFLDYAAMTNRLYSHPQWYNAITHNCTTEIFTFQTMKSHPFDWRILLNGKADQMEYQRGELAGDLPFPELKQRALINPAARAADKDLNFSVRIREGRPGFTQ
ncbi:MAG: DUF4105 domain-containing protein [Acidobacteriaceae bacterium]